MEDKLGEKGEKGRKKCIQGGRQSEGGKEKWRKGRRERGRQRREMWRKENKEWRKISGRRMNWRRMCFYFLLWILLSHHSGNTSNNGKDVCFCFSVVLRIRVE